MRNQTEVLCLCFDVFLKPSSFIICSEGKCVSLATQKIQCSFRFNWQATLDKPQIEIRKTKHSGLCQKMIFSFIQNFYFPFWFSSNVLLDNFEWLQGPARTTYCCSMFWYSKHFSVHPECRFPIAISYLQSSITKKLFSSSNTPV